jgi:DNA-directed RNA polymerase, mitochondrial
MSLLEDVQDRIAKKRDRATKAFGHGSTDENLGLISNYFGTYVELFTIYLETASGVSLKGEKKRLRDVDVQELTLASLMSGINSLFDDRKRKRRSDKGAGLEFSNQLRTIGAEVEQLVYATDLRAYDAKLVDDLTASLKSVSTLAQRRRILKRKAKDKGFSPKEWSDRERLKVGAWVADVLTQGPMFTYVYLSDKYNKEHRVLSLTEDAMEVVGLVHDRLLFSGKFLKPVTEDPEPWSGPYTHIEGFRFPLVRTYMKPLAKFVERKFNTGTYTPTLDAVNHAQGVRWRINEPMLELVRWCYESGVHVEGLPDRDNIEVPALYKPWEDLSKPEQRLYMTKKREVETTNHGFKGDRISLMTDLSTAESLKGNPFWTHVSLDWRGRVYPLPHFNFQRSDHIRSMFLFDEGQVLNPEGLYWLKVHVANCGAFDKIDKAPFDDRVRWVDENLTKCAMVAHWPRAKESIEWWTQADSPFMFVAACKALGDALAGRPCHMPVSFDGSCSGLQHLCAMTRAPEGALVNLTPSERPQDIYQVVAERVKERVEGDLGGDKDELARLWLDFGINRSRVKRNVMTYSYSSETFGMKGQVLEDIMEKEDLRLLKGEIDKHPFEGHIGKAAWYFANHVFLSIKEVVHYPAGAMEFFREVSALYSHESKATYWTTPIGFPVMLLYPQQTRKKVTLLLHDKGVKTYQATSMEDDYSRINKDKAQNSVAPSFVHSMDACHLMMVLLACKEEGINSVALVHDSFGCLPNDAPRFRSLIKRTFREMYEKHDVLEEFRATALDILDTTWHKIPTAPEKGTLDLKQIEHSEYCFA